MSARIQFVLKCRVGTGLWSSALWRLIKKICEIVYIFTNYFCEAYRLYLFSVTEFKCRSHKNETLTGIVLKT